MKNSTSLLLVCVGIIVVLGTASAQNYHFSNGWHPGKRSQESTCQFRNEIKGLLIKIIEDEVSRMLSDPSCLGGLAAFKSLLKKDIYTPLVPEQK